MAKPGGLDGTINVPRENSVRHDPDFINHHAENARASKLLPPGAHQRETRRAPSVPGAAAKP